MLPKFLRGLCLISTLIFLTPVASASVVADAPQAGKLTIAPGNACFIPGLYHDLLNRTPNQTELLAGLTYLANHTKTEYATTLLTSNEYRTDLIRA